MLTIDGEDVDVVPPRLVPSTHSHHPVGERRGEVDGVHGISSGEK